MKTKFQFDKKTGTMVPTSNAVAQGIKANVNKEVVETQTDDTVSKPEFQQEKKIEVKREVVNVTQHQIVRMKRVDRLTPIQLVNNDDMPEAYLDSITTGVAMFREREDYDLCQITDEKTGKVLAYIGGYALQFNFNMAELNTMERIEQCLQGLAKLFRHKIMSQNLQEKSTEK